MGSRDQKVLDFPWAEQHWSIPTDGADVSSESTTGSVPCLQWSQVSHSTAAVEHVYKDFEHYCLCIGLYYNQNLTVLVFQYPWQLIQATVFHLHDKLAYQWNSSAGRNACCARLTTRVQIHSGRNQHSKVVLWPLHITTHSCSSAYVCMADRQTHLIHINTLDSVYRTECPINCTIIW